MELYDLPAAKTFRFSVVGELILLRTLSGQSPPTVTAHTDALFVTQ